MAEDAAFLGVSRSLTGQRWCGPNAHTSRLAEALVQSGQLDWPAALVAARLGATSQNLEEWLAPRLRDLLPDPAKLKDAGKAAARLIDAVAAAEPIAILADYDVDGAASAALLLDWLGAFGCSATVHVPDRLVEGYGPTSSVMKKLSRDHSLIICVDCGTTAQEPIAAALGGADVLVIDHHKAGDKLPDALAVVNPNRQDENGSLNHLAAAGVVFLVLVEAGRALRARGRQPPDLVAFLDLVALATVADVVPLIGVNRAFVRRGLEVMWRRERPGLAALQDIARINAPLTERHLSFFLAPRINAAGRIGDASLGTRLLTSRETGEAVRLAHQLDTLNSRRRSMQDEVEEMAFAGAEARGLDSPLVWAAGAGWHPGVVGIVAGRLADRAQRPSMVISFTGDRGKGSGRSMPGIDLATAVHRLADEGLIGRGGGHSMAVGIELSRAQLEPAMERLTQILGKRQPRDAGMARAVAVDGIMAPAAIKPALIRELARVGPFGSGARAPAFAIADARITFSRVVGARHLRLRFGDAAGSPAVEGFAFRAMESNLGKALIRLEGKRIHLAGELELDLWQGRERVQLRIIDAAIPG